MAEFVKGRSSSGDSSRKRSGHSDQYLKLILRLPAVLKFMPAAGRLADVKNYLFLFCYFLQPTPNNIRSMLLVRGQALRARRLSRAQNRAARSNADRRYLSSRFSKVVR